MRVLILGGTGVISTGITAACLELGYEVHHLNRCRHPAASPVRTVCGDRYCRSDLEQAAAVRPDVVIDMLCFEPGHAQLLVEVFSGQTAQVVLCSTVCVTELAGRRGPLGDDLPRSSSWHYGRNKAACEELLERAADGGSFGLTIVRPGHVYSERFTVHQLGVDGIVALERIAEGAPVLVLDDGQALWQACHARDAGAAFARICGSTACLGRIYSLGLGEHLRWYEVMQVMGRAVGRRPRLLSLDSGLLDSGLLDSGLVDSGLVDGPELDRGGGSAGLELARNVTRHDMALLPGRLLADLPDLRCTVALEDGLRQAWLELRRPGAEPRYEPWLAELLATRARPVETARGVAS